MNGRVSERRGAGLEVPAQPCLTDMPTMIERLLSGTQDPITLEENSSKRPISFPSLPDSGAAAHPRGCAAAYGAPSAESLSPLFRKNFIAIIQKL